MAIKKTVETKLQLTITDDRFDNSGAIYEFDSIDDLVSEMMPTLKDWAFKDYVYRDTQDCHVTEAEILKEMIDELKKCIKEV